MSRVQPVNPENATGEIKEIYQGLGNVINIFRCMANSPETLKGFLELNKAASKTSLSPNIREAIALTLAETNECQYCLSAHTTAATKKLHFSEQEVINARRGIGADAKTNAILSFAKTVVEKRAKVSDSDVAALKNAGFTDKEIIEIFLVIMVNMFTNYFNHIADPKIDFPVAVSI